MVSSGKWGCVIKSCKDRRYQVLRNNSRTKLFNSIRIKHQKSDHTVRLIRIAAVETDHLADIGDDFPDKHIRFDLRITFSIDPKNGFGIGFP